MEHSDKKNIFNKTRLAPTPSGFLHLGNILSFAITAHIARKSRSQILLRIDDLDRLRVNKEYVQDIFDTLDFMEIPWDEGPRDIKEYETMYSQLHRMELYIKAMARLQHNEFLYACNCSRKQLSMIAGDNSDTCACKQLKLPLSNNNLNWRLMTDEHTQIEVKDYFGKNIKTILPDDVHNVIIKKKDGYPSYQLASVVDDLFYEVDLVVRGADLWSSTIVQHQISAALGENDFNNITFYHHPLLMESQDKKLSKSAGSTSVRYLRQNGKSASDIYSLIGNMLGINEPVSDWRELGELTLSDVV
jgi:glutamyl-tRNA synthetase